MNKITDIITALGLFEEDEYYDLAGAIITECLQLVSDHSERILILKHFGLD